MDKNHLGIHIYQYLIQLIHCTPQFVQVSGQNYQDNVYRIYRMRTSGTPLALYIVGEKHGVYKLQLRYTLVNMYLILCFYMEAVYRDILSLYIQNQFIFFSHLIQPLINNSPTYDYWWLRTPNKSDNVVPPVVVKIGNISFTYMYIHSTGSVCFGFSLDTPELSNASIRYGSKYSFSIGNNGVGSIGTGVEANRGVVSGFKLGILFFAQTVR